MTASRARAIAAALAVAALLLAVTGCARPPEIYHAAPTPAPGGAAPLFLTPQAEGEEPIWGIRGGIVLGVHPAILGFAPEGKGGPRGLIRVGYERDGRLYFINFLAISPITPGEPRGLSELEKSPSDGRPGLIITPYPPDYQSDPKWWDRRAAPIDSVAKETGGAGGRRLSFVLRYEPFANGAKMYLLATLDAARPREVTFRAYTQPGSAPVTAWALSSTFGNLTRQRDLLLADGVVNARRLWPEFHGPGFSRPEFFGPDRLAHNARGDVVFAARPDEKAPWERSAYPHPRVLTQFFRKPRGSFDQSLRGVVNGRTVYWKTNTPVPGGITFENVALAETFHEGSPVVFGYSGSDFTKLLE